MRKDYPPKKILYVCKNLLILVKDTSYQKKKKIQVEQAGYLIILALEIHFFYFSEMYMLFPSEKCSL